MSVYFITNTDTTDVDTLTSYNMGGWESYSNINCISLETYKKLNCILVTLLFMT